MEGNVERRGLNAGSLALGGILICMGAALLMGQVVKAVFHIDLGAILWPFTIIVPGVLLLGFGSATDDKIGEPLSILGGMATMTGLVLFFENVTGLWASMAYVWALMIPGGAGIGLVLYGLLRSRQDKVRDGIGLLRAAVVMLAIGFVFFELVLGLNGFGVGRIGWPLLLIGLGVVTLFANLVPW